jgi:hypothetical protein
VLTPAQKLFCTAVKTRKPPPRIAAHAVIFRIRSPIIPAFPPGLRRWISHQKTAIAEREGGVRDISEEESRPRVGSAPAKNELMKRMNGRFIILGREVSQSFKGAGFRPYFCLPGRV